MRKCPICSHSIGNSGRCDNTKCHYYSYKILESILEVEEEEVCPDCEGGCFTMVCYGGSPVEAKCETCEGSGVIE